MKKILSDLFGFAAIACVLLAGAENLDGSCCLPWTLGFIAGALLLSFLSVKRNPSRRNG